MDEARASICDFLCRRLVPPDGPFTRRRQDKMQGPRIIESIPDKDEVLNATLVGLNQQFDRIPAISRLPPCRVRSPRTFVPQSQTRTFPLFTGERLLRQSYALHVFISLVPAERSS